VFENNTPELQYDYIEALGDGRGYTFGYCGFTTGTGDGLQVILQLMLGRESQYPLTRRIAEAFERYVKPMEELAKAESDSLAGLEGFEQRWKTYGANVPVIAAQHVIGDTLYWLPAVRIWAQQLGWTTMLGLACLYDTIIQHGEGKDPDSIGGIIQRTVLTPHETQSICNFLTTRRAVLENATDPDTREEWKNSVPRVDALFGLVNAGNFNLDPPVYIRSQDFNHVIK
jgi:chitosanase